MYKNTYAAVVSVSVAAISSQSQTTALQLYAHACALHEQDYKYT